jgi:nucleotide-binding universal stress UspA family protein
MYRKILVPVDGSATANAGLQQAITLAKNQDATLHLVHVVDENVVMHGMDPAINVGSITRSLVDEGREILANAEAVSKQRGVKADTALFEVVAGGVADRIVREAMEWHADIIVMGTHGRQGIGKLLMGSDAEAVLRMSAVPMLLVKNTADTT